MCTSLTYSIFRLTGFSQFIRLIWRGNRMHFASTAFWTPLWSSATLLNLKVNSHLIQGLLFLFQVSTVQYPAILDSEAALSFPTDVRVAQGALPSSPNSSCSLLLTSCFISGFLSRPESHPPSSPVDLWATNPASSSGEKVLWTGDEI